MAPLRNLCVLCALCVSCSALLAASGSWNGIAFTHWNGIAQTAWNSTAISCGIGCTPGTNTLTVTLVDSTNTTAQAGTYAGNTFTTVTNATYLLYVSGSPTGTQTVT